MNKKIIEKIKIAPLKPGVYLFKNKEKKNIYIGRAVNLRHRLKNYLNPTDPRIKKMVAEADDLVIKNTKNLLQAIILEANLIKKYEPFYNVKEKDNRSFVYIFIPKGGSEAKALLPPKTKWSYPKIIRGRELNKYLLSDAFVFGPIQSYSLAKNFLFLIRKIFPFSTCRLNQSRPCFYFQIGLCPGKCIGKISENDYQKIIDAMIDFLSGKTEKAKKFLETYYPEKLIFLNQIDDSALIIKEAEINFQQRVEAYDISHFGGKQTVGSLIVFENNDFNPSSYKRFKIKNALAHDDLSALKEMLERRFNHPEWDYPDLILVDGGKTQIKVAEEVLEEKKINIPVVGIAKFKNDKLIFGKNIKKSVKELLETSFDTLRKIRDEAHRFANSYRKKLMRIKTF
jgi:excinuclease ABC subunit C